MFCLWKAFKWKLRCQEARRDKGKCRSKLQKAQIFRAEKNIHSGKEGCLTTAYSSSHGRLRRQGIPAQIIMKINIEEIYYSKMPKEVILGHFYRYPNVSLYHDNYKTGDWQSLSHKRSRYLGYNSYSGVIKLTCTSCVPEVE